ncbi:MAG: L-threonylcarbamoyladenylate synthase [bacterium]
MKVVKADPINPELSVIEEAVSFLKAGKVIAFPTDTVYGIAVDVFNDLAVEKIFEIKGRDINKPLQVLIARKDDLNLIIKNFTKVLHIFISEFWPGPLTIIVPARNDFPLRVRCGLDNIGVRMPANPIALKIINAFGLPVAASSANISGMPDPKNAEDVIKYMGNRIDLIIDGGQTTDNIPSTVLDISVNPPVILRHGKLSESEINRVLNLIKDKI